MNFLEKLKDKQEGIASEAISLGDIPEKVSVDLGYLADMRPISPFKTLPKSLVRLTCPASVINHYPELTYGVLKGESLQRGTLSMVSTGEMELNADQLGHYRRRLASIPSVLKDYPDLATKRGFSGILEGEYAQLYFQGRHLAEYSGVDLPDLSGQQVVDAIISVWRAEIATGEFFVPNPCEVGNVSELIATRTRFKGKQRGLHRMARDVLNKGATLNSRIKNPLTNLLAYTNRWVDSSEESGWTTNHLLSVCFYLGINPLTMLITLADSVTAEARSGEGTHYKVMTSATNADDLMAWYGAISPVVYAEFFECVFGMGLIPDGRRWVMGLLCPEFIFSDMPGYDDVFSVMSEIGRERSQEANINTVSDGLFMSFNLDGSWADIRERFVTSWSAEGGDSYLILCGMFGVAFTLEGANLDDVNLESEGEDSLVSKLNTLTGRYHLALSEHSAAPAYRKVGRLSLLQRMAFAQLCKGYANYC
jgi:hypothetical protein